MSARDSLEREPQAPDAPDEAAADKVPDQVIRDRPLVDRTTRIEVSAGLRLAVSGDSRPPPDEVREVTASDVPEQTVRAKPLHDPDTRAEVSAELRQALDGDWRPRRFEAPQAELARFNPERAGLPATTLDSATEYVARHRDSRPWLAVADSASPEAARVLAALDAGNGHGHIRHEGWVTEEANRRRVAYREDPAQLDPEKRSVSIDGLRRDDQRHRSGDAATRITDPDAFATAFARGTQHPKVREALDRAIDSGRKPSEVAVPIADLLGSDGHHYCTGWQLQPVDGSMATARSNRNAWVASRAEETNPGAPDPQAAPVATFQGGEIVFAFTRNDSEKRYEVVTIFPRPAQQQTAGDHPQKPLEERSDGPILLGTSSERPVCDAH